jgi:phosphatidate cytidylyltransferase
MKRILTAAVLILVTLALVFCGPFWLFTLFCAIAAGLAFWEYLDIADAIGAQSPRIVSFVAFAAIYISIWKYPDFLTATVGAIALALLTYCTFHSPVDRILPDAASVYIGIIYVGLSFATLPLLFEQSNGPSLLLFLFVAVWSGDIAALYIGKAFGKHKLAPQLSPGKTWEGSLASLVASAFLTLFLLWVASFLTAHSVDNLSYPGSWFRWLVLAVIVNAAGQLGDLVESGLKRAAGIKDSGSLLPGHGGVLDRIDALLLAAPVLWYAHLAQQYF